LVAIKMRELGGSYTRPYKAVLRRLLEPGQYTSFAFTAHLIEAGSTPPSAPSAMRSTTRLWNGPWACTPPSAACRRRTRSRLLRSHPARSGGWTQQM